MTPRLATLVLLLGQTAAAALPECDAAAARQALITADQAQVRALDELLAAPVEAGKVPRLLEAVDQGRVRLEACAGAAADARGATLTCAQAAAAAYKGAPGTPSVETRLSEARSATESLEKERRLALEKGRATVRRLEEKLSSLPPTEPPERREALKKRIEEAKELVAKLEKLKCDEGLTTAADAAAKALEGARKASDAHDEFLSASAPLGTAAGAAAAAADGARAAASKVGTAPEGENRTRAYQRIGELADLLRAGHQAADASANRLDAYDGRWKTARRALLDLDQALKAVRTARETAASELAGASERLERLSR